MIYLVTARMRVNCTGVEELDTEKLSEALDDFFDTADFPTEWEQPTYDEDGEVIDDEDETFNIDVQQVDIIKIDMAL
jgi:hypothetical protein